MWVIVYLVHLFYIFFFSSRRRHTRCALVTGVQTCALPICSNTDPIKRGLRGVAAFLGVAHFLFERRPDQEGMNDGSPVRLVETSPAPQAGEIYHYAAMLDRLGHVRAEERRVGQECVSTCRSRG